MAALNERQTGWSDDRLVAHGFLMELLKPGRQAPISADLSTRQWQLLVDEVVHQRVGALAWRRLSDLPQGEVPAGVLAPLREHYVRNAFRNARLLRETADATRALAAESIPVMLLKGIHLARFVYEEPALRSMADIDLMVPRDRIRDAERVLVGMGYGPVPRPDIDAHCAWSNHLAALEKEDAEALEVHYDIERPTSPFAIENEALWNSATGVSIENVDVAVLAPEHLLIHLCLHLAYHHKFERSALKGLIDVATVLARSDHIDWDAFVSTANRWKAGCFAYTTLRLAKEALDAGVPAAALARLDHGERDDDVVTIAGRFILAPTVEVFESLVELQRTRSWKKRFTMFLRGVFPPPERLREIYGLAPRSPLVWTLYPVRIADLIRRRAGVLARVVVRAPTVTPHFDRERDRLRIAEWAGYEDVRSTGH